MLIIGTDRVVAIGPNLPDAAGQPLVGHLGEAAFDRGDPAGHHLDLPHHDHRALEDDDDGPRAGHRDHRRLHRRGQRDDPRPQGATALGDGQS